MDSAYTGVRVAELVRIHLDDVDLDACRIRITQGKGAKDRTVPFPGSFTRNRGAGTDRFTFSGRIGGRALKPGRYRLLATPGAGRTVRATFGVIK